MVYIYVAISRSTIITYIYIYIYFFFFFFPTSHNNGITAKFTYTVILVNIDGVTIQISDETKHCVHIRMYQVIDHQLTVG